MSAGTASALIDNEGSLTVGAQAQAVAADNFAQAVAVIATGINQNVRGETLVVGTGKTMTTYSGDANAAIVNDGSIQIAAIGTATGTSAMGNGNIEVGIGQLAMAAGEAAATLTNAGLIEMSVRGSANASENRAYAGAGITIGLGQRAIAGSAAEVNASNAATMPSTRTLKRSR